MRAGSRTAASVNCDIDSDLIPCDSWTQTEPTSGEWANHAGSMLLGSLDSDADASVVSKSKQKIKFCNQRIIMNFTAKIDVHIYHVFST